MLCLFVKCWTIQFSVIKYEIYNTDFVKIIITFTDENRRPLEKEDKINLIISMK